MVWQMQQGKTSKLKSLLHLHVLCVLDVWPGKDEHAEGLPATDLISLDIQKNHQASNLACLIWVLLAFALALRFRRTCRKKLDKPSYLVHASSCWGMGVV